MEFRELQSTIMHVIEQYGKNYKIAIDEDFALLKLYEEVGEFAQAVLIHRQKCRTEKYLSEEDSKAELAKELADILGMVIVNAHLLGVDLQEAVEQKWKQG